MDEETLATYHDNNIALLTSLSDISSIPDDNFILEGYLFAFVIKGRAEIRLGNDTCVLQPGDIFGCNPRGILSKTMLSMDLEVRGLFVESHYIEELANQLQIDWTIRMLGQAHDVLHGTDDDIQRLLAYTDLLQMKLSTPQTPNKQKAIDRIIAAMAYELFDIQLAATNKEEGQLIPTAVQRHSPAEHIFQSFVKMLSNQEEPFHSVAEYAARLNITPKYFSSVCKRLTGKNASTIIDEEVIRTARLLLRDNSLSIKQIADQLGFVNQSHFGSFFRRHTGISPQHFRERAVL